LTTLYVTLEDEDCQLSSECRVV